MRRADASDCASDCVVPSGVRADASDCVVPSGVRADASDCAVLVEDEQHVRYVLQTPSNI